MSLPKVLRPRRCRIFHDVRRLRGLRLLSRPAEEALQTARGAAGVAEVRLAEPGAHLHGHLELRVLPSVRADRVLRVEGPEGEDRQRRDAQRALGLLLRGRAPEAARPDGEEAVYRQATPARHE